MSSDEWRVAVGTKQRGPFNTAHLQRLFAEGKLSRETLVWRPGMREWAPADQVSELLAPNHSRAEQSSSPETKGKTVETNPASTDAGKPRQPPPGPTPPTDEYVLNETRAKGISAIVRQLPAPGEGSRLPFIVSGIACLLSIFALFSTVFHDPLGRGISAYDFTTPEDSLQSQIRLSLNQDLRAQLELQQLRGGDKLEEKLSTLKVHKQSEYQGQKILYVSYEENGISKYDIETFEKDADTGLWFPTYLSTYGIDDTALKEAIESWQSKSGEVKPEH